MPTCHPGRRGRVGTTAQGPLRCSERRTITTSDHRHRSLAAEAGGPHEFGTGAVHGNDGDVAGDPSGTNSCGSPARSRCRLPGGPRRASAVDRSGRARPSLCAAAPPVSLPPPFHRARVAPHAPNAGSILPQAGVDVRMWSSPGPRHEPRLGELGGCCPVPPASTGGRILRTPGATRAVVTQSCRQVSLQPVGPVSAVGKRTLSHFEASSCQGVFGFDLLV